MTKPAGSELRHGLYVLMRPCRVGASRAATTAILKRSQCVRTRSPTAESDVAPRPEALASSCKKASKASPLFRITMVIKSPPPF